MQTYEKIDIQELPLSSPLFRKRVETFLAANGLRLEEVDSYYVLLDSDGKIKAGAGIHNDVVKCVAVDSNERSGGLLTPLVSHIISHASQNGLTNLKVFTKPEHEDIFKSLGFHLVASAPKAILMENGHGLEDYLRTLPSAGSAAGVIVMNANPFTLGHEYLVRQAANAVEHLFVIPVMEEASLFPYEERLAMIKAGCGSLATVLEGSGYQISEATFPTYFLKDLSEASETQIRLDLDLFGRHIAPALGASVRFVGSEPSDPLTARYNELMKEILPKYGITVVEIPRLKVDYTGSAAELRPYSAAAKRGWTRPGSDSSPVTASSVRENLKEGRFFEAAKMTPATTWPYLVAELMARAMRMELDAPLKPGLVDLESNGAHSDMDYALMKGSIDVIRRSFVRHLVGTCPQITGSTLASFGKAIEADVLAYTGGVNTYRGAIFALGLASMAALELAGGGQLVENQSNTQNDPGENGGVKTGNIFINSDLSATAAAEQLSATISRLANQIDPAEDSHGVKAVNEYGVKGALQMAREGYKPLFEDWLPYMAVGAAGLRQYSAAALRLRSGTAVGELIEPRPGPDGTTAEAASPWRLQKTLLRIMSQLDDTCVIHRAGYERAQEVKEEARALLEQLEGLEQLEEQKQLEGHEQLDSSGSITSLKQMKERYDAEGISPGGAADMLALTVLVDSLLR